MGDAQDAAAFEPIAGEEFDFVLFGDVLEHLTTPERALDNIKPHLAPEGHVLICVPSIIHWSIRRNILFGKFEYQDTGPLDRTHVHFFTPRTVRKLVRDCGFRIVRESGVPWLPRVVYRLPVGVRTAIERIARLVARDLVDGQTLLDVVIA